MKEVYILATRQVEPVPLATIQDALEDEDVEVLTAGPDQWALSVRTGEARTDIVFESREGPLGWTPDFLTGSDTAEAILKEARGFYRISFEPGKPQPTAAVFEALWCARTVMEHVDGVLLDVTALKLHETEDVEEITELEFDIRDHVNLHAVAVEESDAPLWVHSHGMDKFGARDVEVFQLAEDDLPAAESFLHQLCTDIAFGQAPPLRATLEAGDESFMLTPSEEARASLMGVPLDAFEGHEGQFLTVLSATGRHNVSAILAPYRKHFEAEPAEVRAALQENARMLLPAFKARFHRRGLMEPWSFRVRAGFESHPEGEAVHEDLWVEVLAWDQEGLTGKLVDGGAHTTEWRKGATVRVNEAAINALAVVHEGRPLDQLEMRDVLSAERPS